MACERHQERLIEEAIAPGGNPELAEHFASCAACRADLAKQHELQARISGGISAMVNMEPSPALMARIRLQIAAEPAPRRFGWMWIPVGVATAAILGFAVWFGARQFIQRAEPGSGTLELVKKSAPQETAPQQNTQVTATTTPKPTRKADSVVNRKPIRAVVKPPVIQTVSTQEISVQHYAVVIPPGQREAVLKLVAALRSGRVDVAGLTQPAPPQEITPLEIKPLKIATLDDEKSVEKSGGGNK
jgi:hypothetical protein